MLAESAISFYIMGDRIPLIQGDIHGSRIYIPDHSIDIRVRQCCFDSSHTKFHENFFSLALIGTIDQMQDDHPKDLFTPELLEMLVQVMSGRSGALDTLLSLSERRQPDMIAPNVNRGAASHAENFIDTVTSVVCQDQLGPARLETPRFTVSPTNESIESAETSITSGFHMSPGKEDILDRNDSLTGFNQRASYASGAPTTLMVKNIPNRVTREEFAEEIMSKMPIGSFDFLYLPIDFKSRAGFGYAFINLTSDENVDEFVANFHKRRLSCAEGIYSKPLEVTVARVQGFTANINRLISSPVLFQAEDASHPLIFNRYQVSIPFKALMQLNRASILFHTRPSIEDLMAMAEAEMLNN
jgi:hypothetical protein